MITFDFFSMRETADIFLISFNCFILLSFTVLISASKFVKHLYDDYLEIFVMWVCFTLLSSSESFVLLFDLEYIPLSTHLV